jgi:hypothetical protein
MRFPVTLACVITGCASTPQQGPLPTSIAPNQQNPSSIATTGTDLYWVDVPQFADVSQTGRIMHSSANGPADVLADAQPCPVAVTAEASAVYWVRCDGAVLTAPTNGGAATTLLTPNTINNFNPIALATTSDAIFVLSALPSNGAGAIMRVSKEPHVAPDVAALNLSNPVAFALDATNLYWVEATDGAVYQRIIQTGFAKPPTRIATAQGGMALAVDATRVYYVDFGTDGEKQVHSVPIGGGAVIDYDTQGSSATAVAVDSQSVYWVAPGMEAVLRAPLAGGVSTTVAVSRGNVANAIALSADHVFFADDPTSGSTMPTTLEAVAK